MLSATSAFLLSSTPAPEGPVVGCATCWAAKYCASFSLTGPQPPPACPLLPRPTARPPRRQPPSAFPLPPDN